MSKQRKTTQSDAADEMRVRRDEAWDNRLRTVGDANYVEVDWSRCDPPYWPLPTA